MWFTKMHGIGNDYVYINAFEETVHDPAELARIISDRHTGIGADGLILVLPPDADVDADVRMRMFNADGTEAEMCGNGIRCVAKLAHDHGISTARPMKVQTASDVLLLDYRLNDDDKVDSVTVDMGQPVLDIAQIPVDLPGQQRAIDHPCTDLFDEMPPPDDWHQRCGLDARMSCISMGNPHVVFFCDHVDQVPLERLGPVIEHHRLFPQRVNAHFVQIQSPSQITMRTWERGSGLTQACGTGACAVCVAGSLRQQCERQIIAHLPGGDLELYWRPSDNHVHMTGPAVEVFRGQWSTFT